VRTKVTLVLLFLNVALFFFIFKFERHWRTEAASLEARRRVLGAEAADIRSLELDGPAPAGAPIFSLVRRRDQWMLTKPLDWPAKPTAVSSLLHELQLLEHETSFSVDDIKTTNQTLADFGLKDPKLTLTFTSGDADGPKTKLLVGDTTKVGNRLYLLAPDNRIHVVNRSLIDALSLPIEQLRADSLLTIPVYEAHSLSIRAASSGAPVHVHNDGKRWMFDTPIIAPASKTAIEITINELNALHPKTFNPPPPATLPSAAPALRLALEGNNRSEVLALGEPVAGAANEFYAQIYSGTALRNALFTVGVSPDLIEKLRGAQVKLRERRILDFDPRAVTAVTIAAPILPNLAPITLQRLVENTAAPSDNAAWQVVRRSEGTQAPQTLAADLVSVQRLLTRLALLAAREQAGTKEQGFVSDAPTSAELETWGFNRPEREVTLAFGAGTPPIVLRLGTGPGAAAGERDVYARVGNDPGASVYAVDPELVRDVAVDLNAWRDRLVYELPAGARISALKITDLAKNQPLVDAGFDASGEPTGDAANPDALKKLAEQLRRVRAGAFIRDGFVEHLTIGGDDRAWRYRIDFTAGLPGSAGAEQARASTLFVGERLGGAQQVAGSKELNTLFELELPLIDALYPLTENKNDPGPPAGAGTKK